LWGLLLLLVQLLWQRAASWRSAQAGEVVAGNSARAGADGRMEGAMHAHATHTHSMAIICSSSNAWVMDDAAPL
jgi:hypothetical protein